MQRIKWSCDVCKKFTKRDDLKFIRDYPNIKGAGLTHEMLAVVAVGALSGIWKCKKCL
jgi:hypothetical protein